MHQLWTISGYVGVFAAGVLAGVLGYRAYSQARRGAATAIAHAGGHTGPVSTHHVRDAARRPLTGREKMLTFVSLVLMASVAASGLGYVTTSRRLSEQNQCRAAYDEDSAIARESRTDASRAASRREKARYQELLKAGLSQGELARRALDVRIDTLTVVAEAQDANPYPAPGSCGLTSEQRNPDPSPGG